MASSGDQRVMTFDDGTQATVADYSARMTVYLQDLSTMADGLENIADTIDFYNLHLQTAVADVPAAVGGCQDAGRTFLNGDGTHDGYKASAQHTFDAIKALSANLRAIANDPVGGLRVARDKIFNTEQRNLALFGVQAVDPSAPQQPGATG